nr:tetratricopeptide repeat protein [Saprospiraceae bacterium]
MIKFPKNKVYIFALGMALLISIPSCTSYKKKGELSKVGQLYENTTAYYNGYFNANELYEESIRNIENSHRDNYNLILPIFPYQAAEDVRPEYANLDLAMEKVSTVVALRRASDWTDDCYLMLAKCQYIKKDYESAEKTLNYLVHYFDPNAQSGPEKVTKTGSKIVHNREIEVRKKQNRRQVQRERRKARRQAEKERKQARKEAERNRKQAQRDRQRGKTPTRSQKPTEGDQVTKESPKPVSPTTAPQDKSTETGLLGHKPAYNEALIWMAKNYIQRDQFSRAMLNLQQVREVGGLSDKLRAESYLVEAHLHITRREYPKAIQPLEEALPLLRDRQKKARYSFILGQLYQKQGNHRIASTHYENAGNWTSDFEMEFNANLSEALSSETSIEGSLRELERFARDSKNANFRDKIYYTIGMLHYNQGQKEEAIESLMQALEHDSGNQNQLREIYYLLATINLEQENYVEAATYYERTKSVMPNTDDRYKEVDQLSNSLAEIGEYLQQLNKNDSLLIVSGWPEEEQRKWAERQFARERDAREAMEKSSEPVASKGGQSALGGESFDLRGGRSGGASMPGGGGPRAGQLESNFFAYDERQVKRGKRNFEQKYGSRELVDDWRRSNSPFYLSQIGSSLADEEFVPQRIVPESKIGEYLDLLPKNEAEKMVVKQGIIDALFYLGVIFRDKMENYLTSAEYLERLTSEFPSTNHELKGLYYLYLDYKDLEMEEDKMRVQNKIIRIYPNSKYAMILRDPSNIHMLMEEENRLLNYYKSIYNHFEKGDHQEVQKRIARSVELFGSDHEFSSKIALLNAMSLGNLNGKEVYIEQLQEMIAQHPNTAEETRAREILRFLQGDSGAFERYSGEVDIERFVTEPTKMHYVIVVLHNSKEVSLNDAQIKISDFNQKYYQLAGLRISNHFLDTKSGIPLILLRSFNNKDQGMRYVKDALSLKEEFLPEGADFEIYPITQRNYREVLRDRSVMNYKAFYEQNYN